MTLKSFTCPCCGTVSCNPIDVRQGFCGRCYSWTGDPLSGLAHIATGCPYRRREQYVKPCEWENIFHICAGPAIGFRLYQDQWLRVCWLHEPCELVLAG